MFKGRNGLATGLLVSGRAGAAPLVSPLVQRALAAGGAPAALRALALFVGCTLLPAALSLRGLEWTELEQPAVTGGGKRAGAAAGAATTTADSEAVVPPPRVCSRFEVAGPPGRRVAALLWLALLCGSGPGLLCHGHAAALLQSAGEAAVAAGAASALGRLGIGSFAAGSICGRLGGGLLIDTVSCRSCLVAMPCLTAALVASPLALPSSVPLTAAALLGCGLSYGLNAVVSHPACLPRIACPQPRPQAQPDALHPLASVSPSVSRGCMGPRAFPPSTARSSRRGAWGACSRRGSPAGSLT